MGTFISSLNRYYASEQYSAKGAMLTLPIVHMFRSQLMSKAVASSGVVIQMISHLVLGTQHCSNHEKLLRVKTDLALRVFLLIAVRILNGEIVQDDDPRLRQRPAGKPGVAAARSRYLIYA
jgi:hypothetical protein